MIVLVKKNKNKIITWSLLILIPLLIFIISLTLLHKCEDKLAKYGLPVNYHDIQTNGDESVITVKKYCTQCQAFKSKEEDAEYCAIHGTKLGVTVTVPTIELPNIKKYSSVGIISAIGVLITGITLIAIAFVIILSWVQSIINWLTT